MPLHQLPPRIKRVLASIAAVLVAVAALPLLDISSLKQRIVQDASHSLQRRISLGAVRLALLPRPGITLEDLQLFELDGQTPLLRLNTARLSLGWSALGQGKAEFVDARVEGLYLHLVSQVNGQLNIDELLRAPPLNPRVNWRFDRVDLVRASLDWQGAQGKITRFSDITLHALNPERPDGAVSLEGRVAGADWGGGLRIESHLFYDRQQQTLALDHFQLALKALTQEWQEGKFELTGQVLAGALPWRLQVSNAKASARARRADQLWQLDFNTPQLRFGESGLKSGALQAQFLVKSPRQELTGEVAVAQLAAEAQTGNLLANRATIQVRFTDDLQNAKLTFDSPLRLDGWRQLSLTNFALSGAYRHKVLPQGAIQLGLSGLIGIDFQRERFDMQSRGALDGSPVAASFSMENFLNPRYAFGVDLARLDLTPYLPAASDATARNTRTPLDWSWLDKLTVRGDLRLGELDIGRFRVYNLKTHLEAANRQIWLNPLSALIYGGQLQGSLGVDTRKQPTLKIRQTLTDMRIAALLADTLGLDRIAGRGNLKLDLHTRAESLSQARQSVSGTARVSLTRGTLAGIDIGDTLRGLRSNLARLAGTPMPADTRRRTAFSTLNASFILKDGLASSKDLQVEAPYLKLGGEGEINLAAGSVDYRLLATVLGGSGVPELDGLAGLAVPISIAGALAAPSYQVDTREIKARLAAPLQPPAPPGAETLSVKSAPLPASAAKPLRRP